MPFLIETYKILKGQPVLWRLLGPSECLAEKLVLKPNAPKHNRAATFEALCGEDASGISLGESLYSLGIILFKKMGVKNTEKRRHESAKWL